MIINHSDAGGGAAIAAMSLHEALLLNGVDSHLAVAKRTLVGNERVHQLPQGNKLANRLLGAVSWRLGLSGMSGTGSFFIPQQPWFHSSDVINLHLIHGGGFNFLAVKQIAKKKPVVMTIHDMWHFTGHCVYSFDCERWRNGCGKCPYLDVHVGVKRDATAFNLRRKVAAFVRPQVHLVAISRWMETLLKQSVLKDLPIHSIPNGLDTDRFRPSGQEEARHSLGLPLNKTIILCVAANLNDRRKGMDLLCEALVRTPQEFKETSVLVVMGSPDSTLAAASPIPVIQLGFINDDAKKAIVYAAADLFALPTRADNLPVVLQEALACGVPLVSFDVGGVPDLVRPGVTGFVAPPENVDEFAKYMVRLASDLDTRRAMAARGRKIAVAEYSLERQGRQYRSLYESLVV